MCARRASRRSSLVRFANDGGPALGTHTGFMRFPYNSPRPCCCFGGGAPIPNDAPTRGRGTPPLDSNWAILVRKGAAATSGIRSLLLLRHNQHDISHARKDGDEYVHWLII